MNRHEKSIELTSTAVMANNGPGGSGGQDIAIYNIFSIAQWIKGSATSSVLSFQLFGGSNLDTLFLDTTTQNGGPLAVVLHGKGGVEFYNATYSADLSPNVWHHLVLTWDGFLNQFIVFVDGTAAPVGSIITNLLPATLRGAFRSVQIGGNSGTDNNRHYSTAVWDVALDGFDVETIYNNGNAASVDLVANSGTYDKALNLRHWWRFGLEPGNIGKDFGFSYNLINVMDAASSVNAGDIVNDFPGV